MRLTALFFLALIFASLVGAYQSPVAASLQRGERVPLLLFGVDAADSSRHTDTIMLTVFDPVKNYLRVLSIPRDTRIELPGYKFHRVNEIYGYQLRTTKDPRAAASKVMEALGYILSNESLQVTLNNYLQVDFSMFRKIIDIIGGVWVEVKQPMNYDDFAGNYHFHKEPGRYLLKGEEALFYVRFRGPTGDRGRIFRQQEFVRSVIRRMANPMMVFRLPEMVTVMATSVSSSLSLWDFFFLLDSARRLRSENIGFYILPGTTSGPYWRANKDMISPIAAMLFMGKESVIPENQEIVPHAHVITIKVWNASGRAGWAYTMTKFLRSKGYDVVDWGNYAADQLQTRVVDRTGKIENAREVAIALGVENYHSEPNPKALVDVEVIVGQNYTGFGGDQ